MACCNELGAFSPPSLGHVVDVAGDNIGTIAVIAAIIFAPELLAAFTGEAAVVSTAAEIAAATGIPMEAATIYSAAGYSAAELGAAAAMDATLATSMASTALEVGGMAQGGGTLLQAAQTGLVNPVWDYAAGSFVEGASALDIAAGVANVGAAASGSLPMLSTAAEIVAATGMPLDAAAIYSAAGYSAVDLGAAVVADGGFTSLLSTLRTVASNIPSSVYTSLAGAAAGVITGAVTAPGPNNTSGTSQGTSSSTTNSSQLGTTTGTSTSDSTGATTGTSAGTSSGTNFANTVGTNTSNTTGTNFSNTRGTSTSNTTGTNFANAVGTSTTQGQQANTGASRQVYTPEEQAIRDAQLLEAGRLYAGSTGGTSAQIQGEMQSGILSNLQNSRNIENNPYLSAAIQAAINPLQRNFTDTILPAIRSDAVQAGQYGGTRQGLGEGVAASRLNQTIADITAKMNMDAYQQGQELYMQTLGMAPAVLAAQWDPLKQYAGLTNGLMSPATMTEALGTSSTTGATTNAQTGGSASTTAGTTTSEQTGGSQSSTTGTTTSAQTGGFTGMTQGTTAGTTTGTTTGTTAGTTANQTEVTQTGATTGATTGISPGATPNYLGDAIAGATLANTLFGARPAT